ncbi:MAG: FkbM family methyltransferase [Verrucomicrobiota bacterium]|nr:FkbM family methyltransferase [Verrucomicrobiota bacterium]
MPDHLSFSARLILFYSLCCPHHRGKWFVVELLKKVLKPKVPTSAEVVRQNGQWLLHPNDYIQSGLYWLGKKDEWEFYHLEKILKPGAIILDVGANFGYYSVRLAKTLNENCQVYAFEPNPEVFVQLSRNLELNELKCVSAFKMGVGESVGFAGLEQEKGNTGAASLTSGSDIEVTSLDAFVDAQKIQSVSLLKLDVEGYELKALRGASNLLKKFHPIILIELFPHTLEKQGATVNEVCEIIKANGYALYEITRDKLNPLENLPHGPDDYCNVICIPMEQSAL